MSYLNYCRALQRNNQYCLGNSGNVKSPKSSLAKMENHMTVGPNEPRDCTFNTCMKRGRDGNLSSDDQDGLVHQILSTNNPHLTESEACKLYQNNS